jgi:DHA2 family metal-tetracycline-proton antiporter-like MFS transporter
MSIDFSTNRRFQVRVIAFLCSIIFFSVLNGTMFNIAIPDIARDFSLSAAEVSWVATGFIIVFALSSVTYGKLADIYPVRRLMTIGLLLFNFGSLIGYLSDGFVMLLIGRIVQASGGGAFPAMSMLVATRYFPVTARGRVLGAVASTVAFAAGVGPVAGGFIAGQWHWRYLFLVSFFTLFAIYAALRLLPKEETKPDPFDFYGAVLLGCGVTSLLVFVTRIEWFMLPLAVVSLVLFNRHIHRCPAPFVSPDLLRNKKFRLGLYATCLSVGTVFGYFFSVPIMLRMVHDLPTVKIGLIIFPGALTAAILGIVGGRMADRFGGAPIVYAGLALLGCGYLLMARFLGVAPLAVLIVLVVCYTGFSFIQSALAKSVSNTLPPDKAGVGMGFYNLVFFTSGAFGTTFVGRFIDLFDGSIPELAREPDIVFGYLFVLSALTVVAAGLLFYRGFGSGKCQ